MTTPNTREIAAAARRSLPRWWGLTGLAAAALVVLYAVLPAAGVIFPPASTPFADSTIPERLYGSATTVLDLVDLTTVLVMVAALAVMAVVRALPYGIGAILLLCIGSTLTSAAATSWLSTVVVSSALPDGRVVAIASVIAAAALVVPDRVRPAVLGLGAVAVTVISLAAVLTATATGIGIVGSLLLTAVWTGAAGVVMAHSPIAAARERANPLDTAALMLRRR